MSSEQDNSRWGAAADNMVQTFQLESSHLRGRLIRLGAVIDDIIKAHDYPAPVAHLVGETVTLALLLSSMLKYEGIFTLQTKGDGPVGMLVADVTSAGDVRACAKYDADRFEAMERQQAVEHMEKRNLLAQYLGKGHIAFTVDQGENTERYQGIVELNGPSLMECVQHYFNQSEQIATGIKIAVDRKDGHWRAGGIMLQRLPEALKADDDREEQWNTALVLMNSCKDTELLNPALHVNEILIRLFHEEGVRVYTPSFVQKKCRCSPEKTENLLLVMSPDNVEYLADGETIQMDCEFCNAHYIFEKETLLDKIKNRPQEKTES